MKDYSAERIECDELPPPPSEIWIEEKNPDTENLSLMYKTWSVAMVLIVAFVWVVCK